MSQTLRIFILLLSLPLTACASHRYHAHPMQRRPSRSTPYQATPYQMTPYQITQDLVVAVRQTYRSAGSYQRHYSRRDDKAMRQLGRFEQKAAHFHRNAADRGLNDRRLRRNFRKLQKEYNRTELAMSSFHYNNRAHRNFQRVRNLMNHLSYYFQGNPGHSRDRYSRKRNYRYR